MAFNVTDFVTADAHQNGWDLVGWWCGWTCRLGVAASRMARLSAGTAMLVHDAFDGRQNFEETRCASA